MKKNTKTINKVTKKLRGDKVFHVGERNGLVMASVPYVLNDTKNAVLIVSLLVNLFIFTLWLTTLVSTDYANAVAELIKG